MSDFYLYPSGDEPVRPLSNINRKIDVGYTKIVKEHRLADGTLKRDLVAVKRNWTISHEWIPSSSDDSVDAGLGADDLETLFNANGVLVFRNPNEEGSGYSLYNTLVSPDGFKKSLLLRRKSGKCYWSTSITLLEV